MLCQFSSWGTLEWCAPWLGPVERCAKAWQNSPNQKLLSAWATMLLRWNSTGPFSILWTAWPHETWWNHRLLRYLLSCHLLLHVIRYILLPSCNNSLNLGELHRESYIYNIYIYIHRSTHRYLSSVILCHSDKGESTNFIRCSVDWWIKKSDDKSSHILACRLPGVQPRGWWP